MKLLIDANVPITGIIEANPEATSMMAIFGSPWHHLSYPNPRPTSQVKLSVKGVLIKMTC